MQFVDVGECVSDALSVSSGVPRGSVLGPLLFFIYVNDLTEVVSGPVSLKLFADDCVLFMNVRSASDQAVLEEAIDSVEQWCKDWDMEINSQKSLFKNNA